MHPVSIWIRLKTFLRQSLRVKVGAEKEETAWRGGGHSDLCVFVFLWFTDCFSLYLS